MSGSGPSDPRDLGSVPSFLRERARRPSSPPLRGQVAASAPAATPTSPAAAERPPRDRVDPAALPLPGLSRRRLATVAGGVAAVWLLLAFGRQVGAASAASDRAADLRSANSQLRQDVSTLEKDLATVQDDRFVQLQARAFGLGGRGEIPFTLEAGAPSLAPDAPGSAAVRLGASPDHRSPFDAWLTTLFGPDR